ncbi:hypothetical protein B0A48_03177 [Cryoendolithus antarcticus]|uniref:Adenylyltransferase and sulfurtransferase uba4 n=1 Tax=Cryoendolithus antarcticus TaxID=1507870 RepID=A0A1V8TJ94_9PEZI|nr:hypothetical protein B0A48_03177 [Cryoendolithus antarcticus]
MDFDGARGSREVVELRLQIENLESRLATLKTQLAVAEKKDILTKSQDDFVAKPSIKPGTEDSHGALDFTNLKRGTLTEASHSRWPLQNEEYTRYGRQMILPEVGLPGQLRLKDARVLIVGVGGLGCPAAAYLAGAGVGTLGLVDGDTVEISNLHRQIAHSTATVGMSKVDSAIKYLSSLNPLVRYERHPEHLAPSSAIDIFSRYDLVLDCTDRPSSRYLISDAAVLTGKPLVSASALKTEGQLVILNNPPRSPRDPAGGPCYRCVFPKPPPAESVLSCGEGGILGPVVGVMGVLQALEAIEILVAGPIVSDASNGTVEAEPARPTLLMFSANSQPQFRSVRLRSRRKDCAACSSAATISRRSLTSGLLDYQTFCGTVAPVDMLPAESRISAAEFSNLPSDSRGVLIDTRDETQYGICALPGSINVPWTGDAKSWAAKASSLEDVARAHGPAHVVCRLGNDSQLAVKAFQEHTERFEAKDIRGGLRAWREQADPEWPDY